VKQLKIDYRIEEWFIKHDLLMSFNDRRIARLIKDLRVIQKSKQITYQPKPDYLIGLDVAQCCSRQAPAK
jgi:hypothetical protein